MTVNNTFKTITLVLALCLLFSLGHQFLATPELQVSDPKWQWMNHKIFSSGNRQADYVFVGSSYIWCAVNSNMVKQSMNAKNAWNFGRNWNGREVDYVIIKNLLEHQKVKHLIVQFTEYRFQEEHPYARHLISLPDAVHELLALPKTAGIIDTLTYSEAFRTNLNTVVSYFSGLSVRMPLNMMTENKHSVQTIEANDRTNGFFYKHDKIRQDPKFLRKYKKRPKWKPRPVKHKQLPNYSRATFFEEKIKKLCDKYETKLSFLFVPGYYSHLPSRAVYNHFNRFGDVLLPDIGPVTGLENWRDHHHLNQKGAAKFTGELITLLKNGKASSPYFRIYNTATRKTGLKNERNNQH